MIFETVHTIKGNRLIRRIKTSFLVLCGFLCLPIGIYLLLYRGLIFGGTLVVFMAPCLLLYPAIRFFFFGGRDSIAAVVTTVIVEEVSKSAVKDFFKDSPNRKK